MTIEISIDNVRSTSNNNNSNTIENHTTWSNGCTSLDYHCTCRFKGIFKVSFIHSNGINIVNFIFKPINLNLDLIKKSIFHCRLCCCIQNLSLVDFVPEWTGQSVCKYWFYCRRHVTCMPSPKGPYDLRPIAGSHSWHSLIAVCVHPRCALWFIPSWKFISDVNRVSPSWGIWKHLRMQTCL